MTLMKFLRATNVLSAAKDQPHRYKVRVDGLPTFGLAGEPVVKSGKNPGGARLGDLESPAPVKLVERSRPTAARSGWVRKLNPFAPQGAPIPRAVVQGELSLDKVKPVRNDLSDSDLELVAAVRKPEPGAGAVKVESELVPVVQARALWQRVRGLWPGARP